MVDLQVTDQDGNALDFADGANATVSIPLAETLAGADVPATMPMWRYDQAQGRDQAFEP